jgi:hypothetical protein
MKYSYSLLVREYIYPDKVEYEDTKLFQLICPECKEPVFKVKRDEKINYFSHYKKKSDDDFCDLRVDSKNKNEIDLESRENRGQVLKHFLSVFKKYLAKNETGDERIIDIIDGILKNSEGTNYILNNYIEIMKTFNFSKDQLSEYFNDYIIESTENKNNKFPTQLSIELQKDYAYDFYQYLSSEIVKGNLYFLILYSAGFLTERISLASSQRNIKPWERKIAETIVKFYNPLSLTEAKYLLDSLLNYKINKDDNLISDNLLQKLFSEIYYESLGVLLRLPYFNMLKDIATAKIKTTPNSQ